MTKLTAVELDALERWAKEDVQAPSGDVLVLIQDLRQVQSDLIAAQTEMKACQIALCNAAVEHSGQTLLGQIKLLIARDSKHLHDIIGYAARANQAKAKIKALEPIVESAEGFLGACESCKTADRDEGALLAWIDDCEADLQKAVDKYRVLEKEKGKV